MRSSLKTILALISLLAFFRCTNLMDAGSSVSGNARVMGSLYSTGGIPAANSQATLIPADYNPRRDAVLPASHIVTTDRNGVFSFRVSDTGSYNIQASGAGLKNVLITGIHYYGKTVAVPSDTLRDPGAIKVVLPDSVDPATSYLYLPGTTIAADAAGAINGSVIINGVPVGVIPRVSFATKGNSTEHILKHDVIVTPGDTTTILDSAWRYTMRIFLNTTSSGAGVNGNVVDFPVYIRLSSWNFDFYTTMVNGEDIRFTRSDGTPLAHEIEVWDSWNEEAEIWVRVDTVYGNNDQQCILMRWGNPNAARNANKGKVFDTAIGFQGVWHLAERGNDTAFDATMNHYNGVPYHTQEPWMNWGAIGMGRYFDGSNYFTMPHTASGKLNVPQNGFYTISAWVYIETPDTGLQVIAGKGRLQYSLNLGNTKGTQQWEIVKYTDSLEIAWKSVIDRNPTLYGEWNYIVGICSGTEQYLYVNGRPVQSSNRTTSNVTSLPRNTGEDFTIGGFLSDYQNQLPGGYDYITGFIDEVRFSNVVRTADWIKLCYENQKYMLVVFDIP